jgi:hypothetical protein
MRGARVGTEAHAAASRIGIKVARERIGSEHDLEWLNRLWPQSA